MKTLWFQLLLWFGLTFVVVSATFLFLDNFRDKITVPDSRATIQAETSPNPNTAAYSLD